MAEEKISYTVRVHGRVQGVGFRYSTQRQAERLGVRGWVRNEPDGSVSVECEGPRSAVEQFLAYLKEGPPMAHVENVDVRAGTPEGRRRFSVR